MVKSPMTGERISISEAAERRLRLMLAIEGGVGLAREWWTESSRSLAKLTVAMYSMTVGK